MSKQTIPVPDIGTTEAVEVIEISVAVGDSVKAEDSLIVLESDKASMEIPSPAAGKIMEIKIKVGDKVKQGDTILMMDNSDATASLVKAPGIAKNTEPVQTTKTESAHLSAQPANGNAQAPATIPPSEALVSEPTTPKKQISTPQKDTVNSDDLYAGPAVRKLAREMGIDLTKVGGSGRKNRIQKDDIKSFVRDLIDKRSSTVGGSGIPAVPDIDFAQFGAVDIKPLSKLQKLTSANMHRSWLNVPHVTQFDDADITELEEFRDSLKAESEKRGMKITPLPFLLKAVAIALKAHPKFNASLLGDGEHIAFKKYVHIGLAVDTPVGLVVPVIRNVDRKSIWELAEESTTLAQQAKERKLKPADMHGGCFTISSLGSIGGIGFTPIINTPEIAILGVSKLTVKPVWNDKTFAPRKMLPLSLSYDHRAVNGADAGRFFTYLNKLLADIRRLVL